MSVGILSSFRYSGFERTLGDIIKILLGLLTRIALTNSSYISLNLSDSLLSLSVTSMIKSKLNKYEYN